MTANLEYLSESQAVELLLIRAVEEQKDVVFPPRAESEPNVEAFEKAISEANVKAFEERAEITKLAKRAQLLLPHLPEPLLQALNWAVRDLDWNRWLLVAALILGPVLGLASNFLSPSGKVHIVKNPIVVLVLWNLAVYTVLILLRLRRNFPAGPVDSQVGPCATVTPDKEPKSVQTEADSPVQLRNIASKAPIGRNRLIRYCLMSLSGILAELSVLKDKLDQKQCDVNSLTKVLKSFLSFFSETAGTLIEARLHFLLHLFNIGLVSGAIAGTYIRGLLTEYKVVWESTFIKDPGMIAIILNAVLCPACIILDGRWLTPADIQPLLHGEAMAGPWIHKLTVTALFWVAIPRTLLMCFSAVKAGNCRNCLEINLSDNYFKKTMERMRLDKLRHDLPDLIPKILEEIEKFAQSTAEYVQSRFFVGRVYPALKSFRDNGGKIIDLKNEIDRQASQFLGERTAHLEAMQLEFAASIKNIVGQQLSPIGANTGTDEKNPTFQAGDDITGGVEKRMKDVIGMTATVTVAVTSGVVIKTVGLTIFGTLLGTTGPIGLLVGGIGAMAIAATAWVLGREKIDAVVEKRHIPAWLAKLALKDEKIKDSSEKLFAEVKTQVRQLLQSVMSNVTQNTQDASVDSLQE
jgi:hypothetical protein